MVPGPNSANERQWTNGICPDLQIECGWLNFYTDFLFAPFVTGLDEKIGFQCTNKACRKKAHRLLIRI